MMCNSVFVSGSRSIKELSSEAIKRIKNIVDSNLEVLIGDAPGVDTLVQKYLADLNYPHVIIYCTDPEPRNNVGKWPFFYISAGALKGRAKHTIKDEEMSKDALYGLMIHDGTSKGTQANIDRMTKFGKKCRIVRGNECFTV